MDKYRVRFNLGRGDNYKKWKVTSPNGDVQYIDPKTQVLDMKGCTLKNNKKSAQKIFDGSNKFVCAWIECDEVKVKPYGLWIYLDGIAQVRYNPRVAPNWQHSGSNMNIDNEYYSRLLTQRVSVYIC